MFYDYKSSKNPALKPIFLDIALVISTNLLCYILSFGVILDLASLHYTTKTIFHIFPFVRKHKIMCRYVGRSQPQLKYKSRI